VQVARSPLDLAVEEVRLLRPARQAADADAAPLKLTHKRAPRAAGGADHGDRPARHQILPNDSAHFLCN